MSFGKVCGKIGKAVEMLRDRLESGGRTRDCRKHIGCRSYRPAGSRSPGVAGTLVADMCILKKKEDADKKVFFGGQKMSGNQLLIGLRGFERETRRQKIQNLEQELKNIKGRFTENEVLEMVEAAQPGSRKEKLDIDEDFVRFGELRLKRNPQEKV